MNEPKEEKPVTPCIDLTNMIGVAPELEEILGKVRIIGTPDVTAQPLLLVSLEQFSKLYNVLLAKGMKKV